MAPQLCVPPLVLLDDYDGIWEEYENALYDFFCEDFVRNRTHFRGSEIGVKRHPELKGKPATFWHITSTGVIENERTPDLRRCERIRWPKPMIEACDEPEIKVWYELRGGERRIHIWLKDFDYVVVVAVRKGYHLLWTAFWIEYAHQRRGLQKRFEANKNS